MTCLSFPSEGSVIDPCADEVVSQLARYQRAFCN
jgi:hypothetical protein